MEALAAAGGASPRDLLAARATLITTRARLDGARANRAFAQLQLDYTVIRAPIAGIVASVSTEEGETVAASLAAPTFVTLLDPTRIACVALVWESRTAPTTFPTSSPAGSSSGWRLRGR